MGLVGAVKHHVRSIEPDHFLVDCHLHRSLTLEVSPLSSWRHNLTVYVVRGMRILHNKTIESVDHVLIKLGQH